MLLPFRLGFGGRIGSGRQWFSWIHIDDLVGAVHYILHGSFENQHEPLQRQEPDRRVQGKLSSGELSSGPINLVSPNPATNAEFTKTLASVLRRPAIIPLPAFAVRLAFGELADEGLLASARVFPKRLTDHGFRFKHPELQAALGHLLR
jgi:NAD dependent epimerase/dehydratase family enzyme